VIDELTEMEVMILRNVLDGDRTRGVTEDNRYEHDAAIVTLLKRGLLQYNQARPRQRFSLTVQGKAALDAAERVVTRRINGKPLAPWVRAELAAKASNDG
jgi:hypothetical protein